LSGSPPLTFLAWEALPVAYATASIALGITWPHKPHHYVKVGIPSGGDTHSLEENIAWIKHISVRGRTIHPSFTFKGATKKITNHTTSQFFFKSAR
jgi:hypothetical protein